MTDDPVERLREVASRHYRLMPQSYRRRFAGMAVGKRRDLTVVAPIASGMIERLDGGVAFEFEGKPASNMMVQQPIERALLAVSDQDAYATLLMSAPEGMAAIGAVVELIVSALSSTFDMRIVVRPNYYSPVQSEPEKPKAPPLPNGWMPSYEISPNSKPKLRWARTWQDGDDYVGFDGAIAIGRIFRISALSADDREKWLWLLTHAPAQIKLEHPSAGWEETARQAAVRVEFCYQKIRQAIHDDAYDTLRKHGKR